MTYHKHEISEIKDGGLRYSKKKNGSPFEGSGRTGEMMSCIKCSQHKPRASGSFRRFLNANHFFCGECRVVPTQTPASTQAETQA
jgi:hypothetical protein